MQSQSKQDYKQQHQRIRREAKSKCCEAEIIVGGGPSTLYYVCKKCGEACDVIYK